jgi:hypothetical protein
MKIVIEVNIEDGHYTVHNHLRLLTVDAILNIIADEPGVVSVAVMEYDGMGGFDADESTRINRKAK